MPNVTITFYHKDVYVEATITPTSYSWRLSYKDDSVFSFADHKNTITYDELMEEIMSYI
jgi:hypothetical protein